MKLLQSAIVAVFICTFFCSMVKSQDLNFKVKGYALDSLNQPLIGATILLKEQESQIMEAFTLTNNQGYFELVASEAGNFILQITFIGYGIFERQLELGSNKPSIDLGQIILNPTVIGLDEVIVKDDFIPIVIKKDTIEYHADAFKTRPNATVEDLLKKLPGVEVEKDGTIKAQGEEVQNVLVDGKEFFDDDPKIATRNIPAEVVDKVQVFDKASDLAAFTGIEDGNEEKTINLAIKEGKNKGWFGNIEGAYGNNNHYRGKTFVNRFKDQLQLSILGNANDINEQAFSLEDYLKFSGGLEEIMESGTLDLTEIPSSLLNQDGINEVLSGGLNLNLDFSAKTSLRSNFFSSSNDNLTTRVIQSQNALENNTFLASSNTKNQSDLTNHRGKIKLIHKFDPTQQLIVETRLNLNNSINLAQSFQQSLIDNNQIVNEAEQDNSVHLDLFSWSMNLQYQKKFKKIGRYFTSKFEFNQFNSNNQTGVLNKINLLISNDLIVDTIRQVQESDQSKPSYNFQFTFSEPIGKSNYLQLKAGYERESHAKEKLFFDIREELELFNGELSNFFDRTFDKTTIGSSLRVVRKKFNWTTAIDYQLATLNSLSDQANVFERRFHFILPSSFLNYSISNSKQMRVQYQTNTQIPAIDQMQPVLNNSNPLYIFEGNPDLKPEYQHQIIANYTSFNQFYLRSFFVRFYGQYTQQKIVNFTTITPDLRNIVQPINNGEEIMLNGHFSYDSPIKKMNLKFGIDGNFNYQLTPIVINTLEDKLNQFSTSPTFSIENKKKAHIDIKLSYSPSWNNIQYEKNEQFNRSFLAQNYLFELNWSFLKDLNISSDLEFIQYSKDELNKAQNFTFLDITLTKSLNDEQFSFYLSGKNLFSEMDRFQRSGMANQFQSNLSNRLGRIILVGMVYKIRNFG